MIERHATKLADECILLAVPYHGREVLPKRVVLRAFLESRHGLQRLGMVRAQELALIGEHESARAVLVE